MRSNSDLSGSVSEQLRFWLGHQRSVEDDVHAFESAQGEGGVPLRSVLVKLDALVAVEEG
jgi:hypothetical protein